MIKRWEIYNNKQHVPVGSAHNQSLGELVVVSRVFIALQDKKDGEKEVNFVTFFITVIWRQYSCQENFFKISTIKLKPSYDLTLSISCNVLIKWMFTKIFTWLDVFALTDTPAYRIATLGTRCTSVMIFPSLAPASGLVAFTLVVFVASAAHQVLAAVIRAWALPIGKWQ